MTEFRMQITRMGFCKFLDRDGETCSLQKSSLATDVCIWLGCAPNRMHLTQQMVADMLPLLQRFVETGELI